MVDVDRLRRHAAFVAEDGKTELASIFTDCADEIDRLRAAVRAAYEVIDNMTGNVYSSQPWHAADMKTWRSAYAAVKEGL